MEGLGRSGLERFGQFFRECAACGPAVVGGFPGDALLTGGAAAVAPKALGPADGLLCPAGGLPCPAGGLPSTLTRAALTRAAAMNTRAGDAAGAGATRGAASLPSWLGRLRGIGAQQPVFERRPIETADDGVHLFRIRCFDKCESLGFLRFGIADHFNGVRDQAFGCKPAPDIVRSHPNGQIAQKDRKTHSMVIFDSIRWGFCSAENFHEGTLILPQSGAAVNRKMTRRSRKYSGMPGLRESCSAPHDL